MSLWREITATQHGLFRAHDAGGIRLQVSARCRPVFMKPLTCICVLHQSVPQIYNFRCTVNVLTYFQGTKMKECCQVE
jgi:hypothetical protein